MTETVLSAVRPELVPEVEEEVVRSVPDLPTFIPDDEPGELDTLALLLRDIPRGPLLTADQEWSLARRMRGEDVIVPPPGNPRPTAKEAHDRLVEENMRLVISVARKYRGRGLPLEDLIQEGALGLRRAAELFDPNRGVCRSTYASWWIGQASRDRPLVRRRSGAAAESVTTSVTGGGVSGADDPRRVRTGRPTSPGSSW